MPSKQTCKQLSFYSILIVLPFIILLLVELLLRVGGFGKNVPLFIEVAQNASNSVSYLEPNPKVVTRYFADEKLAPQVSPDTALFKKHKDGDSFRIFIQGGSTAAGFPYGRWASLQGMLEQRFKRLYPDKNIEIINTAMAAVNSYTLVDFVDEIIEQQPDLVLIYAGHNEYLGIMGVGSAFAAKGSRLTTLLHLKFKEWRIYQLLQQLYFSLLAADQQQLQTDKTLMSQVVKEKEIPLASELYNQGLLQFKDNMALLLQKYQAAGVPVLLSNLVSNESGQVPFSSIGSVDWQAYQAVLSKSAKAQLQANVAALNSALSEPRKLAENMAEYTTAQHYYKLALNLQGLAQYQAAKAAFVLAKDHDLLRFRAPQAFNDIISELAQQEQVTLVDNQALFNAHADHGIIGNSMILEHLHPTVDGYFLLAEGFAEVINQQQLLTEPAQPYSRVKARLDVPVSKVDKLYGDFVITKLINDYPFKVVSSTNTRESKNIPLPSSNKLEADALITRLNKGNWLQLQQQLLVKYQQAGDIAEAAKIAGVITTAMVNNHQAAYVAGQLYQQLNDWQLASYYHKQALLVPELSEQEKVRYLLALAQDYFLMGNYSASLARLTMADKMVPASAPLKATIAQYLKSATQRIAAPRK